MVKITTFAITLNEAKTKRKNNLANPLGIEALECIELVKRKNNKNAKFNKIDVCVSNCGIYSALCLRKS